MPKQDESVSDRARKIYDSGLSATLEQAHRNKFVAIEPDSGDYFIGSTLSEAVAASRKIHPNRLVHAFRVGHRAAIHFGMQSR